MNKKYFFDTVRTTLFDGRISVAQFAGMEALLAEWDRRNKTDVRKLAYILATVYHETAKTMQPIEEFGKGHGKAYGEKFKYGDGPGKRVAYTKPNKIYYGRGLTQNTWYETYEKLTKAARDEGREWDFLNHPELLLLMEPSVWATFYAMEKGLYTGLKLSDFFYGSQADYLNARKIINGLDCAQKIERYAKLFFAAFLPGLLTPR